MIRVSVHLISANTGAVTELARMDIANMDDGTSTVANYMGVTYIGRDTKRLDKQNVSKSGRVLGWRRNDYHVWNLVASMLHMMGYNKGHTLLPEADDEDITKFI